MREQNAPNSVKECVWGGRLCTQSGVYMCGLRVSAGLFACDCVVHVDPPSTAPLNLLDPGPLEHPVNPAARRSDTQCVPRLREL